MSLNRASSLATKPSLALSRLSSNIEPPARASQLSRTSSVRSRQPQTSQPTHPARFRHTINACMKPLRDFTSSNPRLSEYGRHPESPLVKRDCASVETPQKSDNPSALSSALLTGSKIPRYITSSGEVGVVISHSGWWSTRGLKHGGFNPRLAFDKDLVTALLDSSSDGLRLATVAQGGRYEAEKWPNVEDVEALALAVEWVNRRAEMQVLRTNGGERIVVRKALAETIVVNKVVANKVIANNVVVKNRVAKRGVAKKEAVDIEALELWEDGAAVAVS